MHRLSFLVADVGVGVLLFDLLDALFELVGADAATALERVLQVHLRAAYAVGVDAAIFHIAVHHRLAHYCLDWRPLLVELTCKHEVISSLAFDDLLQLPFCLAEGLAFTSLQLEFLLQKGQALFESCS